MSRVGTSDWVENRARRGTSVPDVSGLWSRREVALALAGRDFRVRYKQAVLGIAWAAIQPIVGLVVFTFVFDRIADVPSDGLPYPAFALVGIIVWNYHSAALSQASQAIVANSSLITKVYFPRLLAPLAALLPPLVDLAISFVILAIVLIAYSVAPVWPAVLLVPAMIACLVATTLGPSLLLAALNVRYRDVRQGLGLLLQMWLFVSPVAYSTEVVDERWRSLYALNPLVGIIEMLRGALLGSSVDASVVLVSAVSSIVLLVVGSSVFLRSERWFADVI